MRQLGWQQAKRHSQSEKYTGLVSSVHAKSYDVIKDHTEEQGIQDSCFHTGFPVTGEENRCKMLQNKSSKVLIPYTQQRHKKKILILIKPLILKMGLEQIAQKVKLMSIHH